MNCLSKSEDPSSVWTTVCILPCILFVAILCILVNDSRYSSNLQVLSHHWRCRNVSVSSSALEKRRSASHACEVNTQTQTLSRKVGDKHTHTPTDWLYSWSPQQLNGRQCLQLPVAVSPCWFLTVSCPSIMSLLLINSILPPSPTLVYFFSLFDTFVDRTSRDCTSRQCLVNVTGNQWSSD